MDNIFAALGAIVGLVGGILGIYTFIQSERDI